MIVVSNEFYQSFKHTMLFPVNIVWDTNLFLNIQINKFILLFILFAYLSKDYNNILLNVDIERRKLSAEFEKLKYYIIMISFLFLDITFICICFWLLFLQCIIDILKLIQCYKTINLIQMFINNIKMFIYYIWIKKCAE